MPRPVSPSLQGRHALVTGASKGIGRAAATAIAAMGAEVTVLARTAERLDALRLDLLQAGAPRAHVLVADMDRREALQETVAAHLEEAGDVHVLVNNAGGPPSGRLLDVADEASFLGPFGRHVLAFHRLVRLCVPGMERAGYGRIVNVISTSVREPIPNLGISNTVRAAVAAWAKTLSRELPPGITMNSVLPGYTETERLEELAEQVSSKSGRSPDDVRDAWIKATPEGRLGQPEELGAVIAFLCGPGSSFIRGVTLPVDGGRLHGI